VNLKVTIRLPEEAARWARRKAADAGASVSRVLGGMIGRDMRRDQAYRRARRRWAKLGAVAGADASLRARRDEIYAERR
jgi:hypothetical protein